MMRNILKFLLLQWLRLRSVLSEVKTLKAKSFFLSTYLSFFLIFLSAKHLLVTLKLWADTSFPNIFHLTACNTAQLKNDAHHAGLCACTCLHEVTAGCSPAQLFLYKWNFYTEREKLSASQVVHFAESVSKYLKTLLGGQSALKWRVE